MNSKKLIAGLLIVAMMFVLTACDKTKPGAPDNNENQGTAAAFPGTKDPDMVVIDVTSQPANLNHFLLGDSIGMEIMRHFMAGIARLDKNDAPVPDMAERWENSEDNLTTTVYLRKDTKWTNGDPVTANDFYYSWVTQLTPDTGSEFASFLYDNIKNGKAFYNGEVDAEALGIKVINDNTLFVEWSHPIAQPGDYFAQAMYFPMNQKAYEEIGAQSYAQGVDKVVSNGPYRLAEIVADDHITLEKNEDYFNAANINVPKIKMVMIGDPNTAVNAFMTGEIDLCGLYSEQVEQLKKQDESVVHSYIDGGSWYLTFNSKNTFLANTNMRKALSYGVDVQSLLDNVIQDGSIAADGLVPDVISGIGGKSYAEARGSLFQYDPVKAKEYLDKALAELGITAADVKLELMTHDSTYGQTQAAYVQQQWKTNLGLDIDIRVLTWQARKEAQTSGDYHMVIEGWGPSENTALTFLGNYVSDSGYNFTGYANPTYDKLIADAISEADPQKQQDNMIAAEKLLIDDMVIGPFYFTNTMYAVSSKVEGIVRTPFQMFNFCDGARIVSK